MLRYSFVFVFLSTRVVRILISLYLYFHQPRWWCWPSSGPTPPLPPLQAGQPRTVDQPAPELHLDVFFYSFALKIFLFSFVSIKTRWSVGSRISSLSFFLNFSLSLLRSEDQIFLLTLVSIKACWSVTSRTSSRSLFLTNNFGLSRWWVGWYHNDYVVPLTYF